MPPLAEMAVAAPFDHLCRVVERDVHGLSLSRSDDAHLAHLRSRRLLGAPSPEPLVATASLASKRVLLLGLPIALLFCFQLVRDRHAIENMSPGRNSAGDE